MDPHTTERREKTFGLLVTHVALAANLLSVTSRDSNLGLNYLKSYDLALKCLVGEDYNRLYKTVEIAVLAEEARVAATGISGLLLLQHHFEKYLRAQYKREQNLHSLPYKHESTEKLSRRMSFPLAHLSSPRPKRHGNSLDVSIEEDGAISPANSPMS